MWGQSARGGPGRIWVGAAVVALATATFVAYDVGGAPQSPRSVAFAEPARNATVVIEEGGARTGFSTPEVTVSGGGTVTVVNLDSMDHTFTSVDKGPDGLPLFDVRVTAGTTATVPGIESLAAGTFAFYCKFHPGMRGVLTVAGTGGGVEPERPTFDQPLVVPPTERGADIRLVMKRARVRSLPEGPRTSMWTFDGTYPGPTIRRRGGPGTHVTIVNHLPKGAGATSTHLHGDHHAAKDDGQPTTQLVRHGESRTYDYPLTVDGKATPGSFFWYHDHRMDRTARNNWRGLQGMFIVTDPPMAGLRLPTGSRDVPLMISERSFTAGNQLTDPFAAGPEMVHGSDGHGSMTWTGDHAPPNDATVGDTVLVNGRAAPYLGVSATRYRLRLLNSSPFSSYNLTLSDGRPILQIGTGSGLLPRAVVRSSVLLGPAQRADVIVDFSGSTGRRIVLESVPAAIGTTGADARQTAVMEFRVGAAASDPSRLPSRLPSPALVSPVPKQVSKTWTFGLHDGTHSSGHGGSAWTIDGKSFDPDRVDHRARLGTVERWRFRNTSDVTHYVHIHAEQWRTVLRDGRTPPPWEQGLEDTWRLEPGEVVEVAARFTDYTGPFMIHCHMLDHEDHGMMARFDVVR
ncbi:multicopper oxidase domain-containing protein [Nocardioides baculatus]|uniref:Multicopper oxidase domain-containing protein n=1 Tax=Nocardioides baculatus TaxID=2801337 RepID=A0ABS1LD08_9ACTN|nr:multicopper oxidase domain-containing protein [Nocardioides baculatus]MBL0749574.1 multicopper oxidase domain-containing protein [Nocardioides baculatus]